MLPTSAASLPKTGHTKSPEVLSVEHLTVAYRSGHQLVEAVDDLSFTVREGHILGICGESGSGKSTALLGAVGLFRSSARRLSGKSVFGQRDLLALRGRGLRELRGKEIGIIFQDPARCFDPLFDVDSHFLETGRSHGMRSAPQIRRQAIDLLRRFQVSAPEARLKQYPFQLSGGMLQRIMLALAVFHKPRLLLADEPTTALDVTTQAGILQELAQLRADYGTAIVLVSHDLSVLNVLADDLLIMYAGQCVESGSRRDVLTDPRHPYTKALLASIPRLKAEQGLVVKLRGIPGSPPDIASRPSGCPFAPRCEFVMDVCRQKAPALVADKDAHSSACYLYSPLSR